MTALSCAQERHGALAHLRFSARRRTSFSARRLHRRWVLGSALCALVSGLACAGPPTPRTTSPPANVAQIDARTLTEQAHIDFLIAEGMQRSRATEDLRHLTDVIGPRLSGSPGMQRAVEWTARKFANYGMDTVAREPFPFGPTWTRGPLTMRLLLPHERWLSAVSWAWAPGTSGPRAGDVVYVDATTLEDFQRRFAGKLRGVWVMTSRPYPRVNPDVPSARDSARVDSLRQLLRRQRTTEERVFLSQQEALFVREGIAGELIDGGKDYGLFVMSGSPLGISSFPQVVIGNQNFAELHRMLVAGERVRVEINASNTFGRDTVTQWNVVGEIRGSELPDEVVLVGAHLDSWDLATGATDNGASSVAVLEAARLIGALAATGVRPRRTIRFVLFGAEEQGLFGSRHYVARHKAELPRYQAVLVLDNGSGRIVSIPLQGADALHRMWTELVRPLDALGPITVRSGNKGATDHMPFLQAGVPGFNYDQLPRGYDNTYHSQLDVFGQAVPEDVKQAATVMAVNALQLANLDRLLPRRR
ncbi:MAG: M20/M25/M40 family metallo-hydrolase [Gemmatimonadaceae bacterium]